jgi:hypothetical protein
VSLVECARFPLAPPDEAHYLRAILMRRLGETSVMPSALLTANSCQQMRDVVRYSLAVSVQTTIDMRHIRQRRSRLRPLAGSAGALRILTCVSRSGRRLSSPTDQFVRAVVDSLDQSLGTAQGCRPLITRPKMHRNRERSRTNIDFYRMQPAR